MEGKDSYLVGRGGHPASVEYGHDSFLRAVGADSDEDIRREDIASHGGQIADPAENHVPFFEVTRCSVTGGEIRKSVEIDGYVRGGIGVVAHLGDV